MILFLDGSPERAAVAYSRMAEEERSRVIWCRTAKEAILTLWDYRDVLIKVTLEHDLGEKPYVHPDREDSGMEVIRFLEKKKENEPKEFEKLKNAKFIVHTWNEYVGPLMTNRLTKLGLRVERTPFGM